MMRECNCAIVNVSADETEKREDGSFGINANVLVEIGAAFLAYNQRVILLVDKRLAACVQILPEIQSVYRWKDRVERASELLLLAKTTRARFDELDRAVCEIHSYETPEIVAVSIIEVSQPYLKWLLAALNQTCS